MGPNKPDLKKNLMPKLLQIRPGEEDEEMDGRPGKIKHAEPDRHLRKLPGLSSDPKQPPFRLVLAKSEILPDLLICPMENFKGVVFFDSETLEKRSKLNYEIISRTPSSVT